MSELIAERTSCEGLRLKPTEPLTPHAAAVARRRASTHHFLFWLAAAVVAFVGILVRAHRSEAFQHAGFDEYLYRSYGQFLDAGGLLSYDRLCDEYLVRQQRPDKIVELPPTRFLYPFTGWLWKRAQYGHAGAVDIRPPGAKFSDPVLASLRNVSACFSVLLMFASGAAAWRFAGRGAGLAVFALVACSPLAIHMSQHALIDGFFTFWAVLALWSLWENLQKPESTRWLALYGLSLAAMVLTKENSFFVYVALVSLLGLNCWLKFGTATRRLLIVTVAAPALAVGLLVTLAGGVTTFIEIYRVLVTKAQVLPYAIMTGDGPWYRYLVDLLTISPLIFCLALGGLYRTTARDRAQIFVLGFVFTSYLIMCNVKYGMNLRYATIWDLPLRLLAVAQICWLATLWKGKEMWLAAALVAALCAYDLRQYHIFFVQTRVYELGTQDLLQAVKILKLE